MNLIFLVLKTEFLLWHPIMKVKVSVHLSCDPITGTNNIDTNTPIYVKLSMNITKYEISTTWYFLAFSNLQYKKGECANLLDETQVPLNVQS